MMDKDLDLVINFMKTHRSLLAVYVQFIEFHDYPGQTASDAR